MSTLACLLMVMPCAKQFWACSAETPGRPIPGQAESLLLNLPKPQAALRGTPAELQRQLTERQLEMLSPAECRVGPGEVPDRAAAVVHFASEEAGAPADRTAAPRRHTLLRQHSSKRELLDGARSAVSGDDLPPETAHR